MDIGREIINHLEWIEKIASLLDKDKIDEGEIQAISQHNKCELGQWLETEASQAYRGLEDFRQLVETHDEFHKLAGDFVMAFQSGKEDEALALQKAFIEMSQQVIGYLNALQEHTGEVGNS